MQKWEVIALLSTWDTAKLFTWCGLLSFGYHAKERCEQTIESSQKRIIKVGKTHLNEAISQHRGKVTGWDVVMFFKYPRWLCEEGNNLFSVSRELFANMSTVIRCRIELGFLIYFVNQHMHGHVCSHCWIWWILLALHYMHMLQISKRKVYFTRIYFLTFSWWLFLVLLPLLMQVHNKIRPTWFVFTLVAFSFCKAELDPQRDITEFGIFIPSCARLPNSRCSIWELSRGAGSPPFTCWQHLPSCSPGHHSP